MLEVKLDWYVALVLVVSYSWVLFFLCSCAMPSGFPCCDALSSFTFLDLRFPCIRLACRVVSCRVVSCRVVSCRGVSCLVVLSFGTQTTTQTKKENAKGPGEVPFVANAARPFHHWEREVGLTLTLNLTPSLAFVLS